MILENEECHNHGFFSLQNCDINFLAEFSKKVAYA
jgi:hypothetical protein